MMSHKVIFALGSNCFQERNVENAKAMLRKTFGSDIEFTKSIWTNPIGIKSEMFLNCIAVAHTDCDKMQIVSILKDIERQCGRTKEDKKMNVVKIDIDLLSYDNEILREEDWKRDYIQNLVSMTLKQSSSHGL